MKKDKTTDYLQVVQDFDKSQGRKTDGFDMPMKNSVRIDGGVDYLAVSRKYEQYLNQDESEVITEE